MSENKTTITITITKVLRISIMMQWIGTGIVVMLGFLLMVNGWLIMPLLFIFLSVCLIAQIRAIIINFRKKSEEKASFERENENKS